MSRFYISADQKFNTSKISFLLTTSKMSSLNDAKRQAAYAAVNENITSEHKIIGIGSGSTVVYVIERILQLKSTLNKECIYIPTSFQSRLLIVEGGLNLGDIDQ